MVNSDQKGDGKNLTKIFGQKETFTLLLHKVNMRTNTHVHSEGRRATNAPESVPANNTLTLIEAYNSHIEDVKAAKIIYPLEADRLTPVLEGQTLLIKELIHHNHQFQAPIVRKLDDAYQILWGEPVVQAMQKLGKEEITCIIIDCSDEDASKLMHAMGVYKVDVNYSVKMDVIKEVKDTVKRERDRLKGEFKKKGIPLPTTNKMVSDVIGESQTYTKKLLKLADSDDKNTIAEQLNNGESISNVGLGQRATDDIPQPRPVGCVPSAPQEYNPKKFCPDCPRLAQFMSQLEEQQQKQIGNLGKEVQNEL